MALANYFSRRRDGKNADGTDRSGAAYIKKRFAQILYLGRQFVESAEHNEAQEIIFERLADVGDNSFGPISLREGGTIVIDQNAGTVRVGAARVWAGGYMHEVPAATLTGVPMVGTVPIGITVVGRTIEASQDPELKGIVPSIASQGEVLSARLRYEASWARSGDPFYPIHTLIDGQIPNERTPPSNDIAELLVERHLRETHGSHIAEGFQVTPAGFDAVTGAQSFIISAGVLRAEGRRVARSTDQRFRRVENPELVQVNGEGHFYPAGGVVALNNGPIDSVQTVTVTKEVVRTLTHQLAGGTDALPDTPVYAIMAVNAGGVWNPGTRTFTGGTNYAETTSWVKQGDGISWAPAGAEPAPGSSVTVVYRHTATVVPQEIRRQAIKLEAAVEGQPVIVSYRYKLPRIDILAINLDGEVNYIEGISSKLNPYPPPCPAPLAPLVRIRNLWGIPPVVEDVDQRRVLEAEVRAFLRDFRSLSDLVSLVSLERDIQERDPASRRGSFVDPFRDDRQRDLGIAQDAAVAGGFLMLPVQGFARRIDVGRAPITLPFVKEAVISQPFRTLSRKINAYLNFAPLPMALSLNPAVDRWNETQETSSSSSSSSFAQEFSYRPDLVGTPEYGTTSVSSSSSSSTSVTSSTTDLPFLRQITVEVTGRLMGPGEDLDRILFDGIDVTASMTGTKEANDQGILTGSFTIPASVPAGTKLVQVFGKGGSRGATSFVGQGTLTINHYHTSSHTHTVAVTIDPVAQSFVLDEMRQITGVRVEFSKRGDPTNHVVLEMRDMDGGLPGSITHAEGSTPGTFTLGDPDVVKPGNWTEIDFRILTTVPANSWRWIALLTDDAEHSVAVAQLGDQSDPNAPRGFDRRRQEWIRANPALGDFADGSNGVTWKAQPDTDLTHEIMAARYTSLTRTVSLGSHDLSQIHPDGISDAIVALLVDAPTTQTRVRIRLTRANGEAIFFEPNTAVSFEEYLTETVQLDMILTGTATLSPIVMPEVQVIWGRLKPSASYVSEANAIDLTAGNVKLRTVVETNTPGTSTVALEIGGPGAWDLQAAASSRALGDGWVEREHLESPYGAPEARTRITLTGTPRFRPAVRQLRQRATEL
ncbi:DUF4815 domain-containing protein [Aureimonas sp. SK2]|uniref:DUF4815 domain-containing protein n=1 Tax=Aureimonas sp. SK2 TaxID=3015992 RepID=UPI0024452E76|nr:DUF4815 domain-containing protein [Aureimonas sp. SK2]